MNILCYFVIFVQFFHLFLFSSSLTHTDDAMEDCGFLKFTDETLKVSFLQTLNTMRKHRLFCDVVLNVSFQIYKIKFVEIKRRYNMIICETICLLLFLLLLIMTIGIISFYRLTMPTFMLIKMYWLVCHRI